MKYKPMDRFDQKDVLYQELLNMFPAFSNLIPIDLEELREDLFDTGVSHTKFIDWDKKRLVLWFFWSAEMEDKELEPHVGNIVMDIKNWSCLTIIKDDVNGEQSIIHFDQVNFDDADYRKKYNAKDEKVMTNQEIDFIGHFFGANYTPEHVILKSWCIDEDLFCTDCHLLWVFDHAELHCYVELRSTPESPRLAPLAQKVFNDPELVSFFPTFEDPFIVIDPHEVDTNPFTAIPGGRKYVEWDKKRIVVRSGGIWLKNKELSRQLGGSAILDIKNWSGLKLVTTRKSSYDVEGETWTLADLEILKEEDVLSKDQLKGMNKAEVFTYDEKQLILSHRLKGEFNNIVPVDQGGYTLHWIFSNPEVGVYATLKDNKNKVTKE